MRIITGTAKGTKLDSPEGLSTRPTSERAKEAIFSMLQFDIEGKNVLELFGGSGQLSLEALSRGANSAFICDSDKSACEMIKSNARKTHLFEKTRVICSDFKSVIKNLSHREKFNLIFIDPPYKSNYAAEALSLLSQGNLVCDGGLIICESDKSNPLSEEGFSIVKHAKYGKAYITVLRKDCVQS